MTGGSRLLRLVGTTIVALAPMLLAGGGRAVQQDDPARHRAVTPAARHPDDIGARNRHETIVANVRSAKRVDLVFIGDSITQGWEGAGREVWNEYYGDRHALNLGISGDQTQHVLWRLENGAIDGIEPKVAVVMIGTNNSYAGGDSPAQIAAGVRAIVMKLREELPRARIVLLDIFPRGAEPNDQRGRVLQTNQIIRKLEDDDRDMIHYWPIGHHFIEPDGSISPEIMPDFLHLSSRGYMIWAEAMEPKLEELLEEPG